MSKALLTVMLAVYAVAGVMRGLLFGLTGWLIGLAVFHFLAALPLRFFTNTRSFAALAVVSTVALEAILVGIHRSPLTAVCAGTTVQAALSAYFARRFYLTMGD
jgi:hypothetical protein